MLHSNGLSGKIPACLGDLPALRVLTLLPGATRLSVGHDEAPQWLVRRAARRCGGASGADIRVHTWEDAAVFAFHMACAIDGCAVSQSHG